MTEEYKIKRLNFWVVQLAIYRSQLVRDIAEANLNAKALEFGYDWQAYKVLNRWVKLGEYKPQNANDTLKTEAIRLEKDILQESHTPKTCRECQKPLVILRKSKAFCNDQCRALYHRKNKAK